MDVTGRARSALKQMALWAGLGTACLCIALAGLGFLISAFYVWLSTKLGPAEALAVTGGVMIILAILVVAIGGAIIRKLKKPQPSMLSEFSGLFGLGVRLVTLTIRRDPRKALIVSLIAGALAEFIVSDRKKED